MIPMVIETQGRSERMYDIYSRIFQDRIVLLGSAVNDQVASLICAQLLFLEAQDAAKPIYMYINSPGGSVTAGLAIYDTMNYVTCPVSTLCMGQAASMGSFLLAAGEKGQRYSLPHSQIMIHQPLAGYSGQVTDIEIHAKECLRMKKMLNEILAQKTGQALDDVAKATERDNFLNPHEALSFGLIDKVISSRLDMGAGMVEGAAEVTAGVA